MIPFRLCMIAGPVVLRQTRLALSWAFKSREYYNHTYDLTPLNELYLANFVSVISGHPVGEIERFISELKNDVELHQSLIARNKESQNRYSSDDQPRFGRRLGWYALIRATKPRIVVETGIDRGLGTIVLAAALKRNSEEGHTGLLFATDIVSDCGHLIADIYSPYYRRMLGDSVKSLQAFEQQVDVFLHDSDHRPEYEWAEFMAIEPRLHSNSIILSDNSQNTSKLREFADKRGLSFLFFQDVPKNHWWMGDGIGCAFRVGTGYSYQSHTN